MKSFKSFLTEDVTPGYDVEKMEPLATEYKEFRENITTNPEIFHPLYEEIYKNCSDLLNDWIPFMIKNKLTFYTLDQYAELLPLLYRGTDRSFNIVIKGTSPVNRVPMSVSKYVNNNVDKILMKHGAKALRRNSIFSSTNEEASESYGATRLVFPFNNSDITFLPTPDLYYKLDAKSMGANQDIMFPNYAKFLDELNQLDEKAFKQASVVRPTDLRPQSNITQKLYEIYKMWLKGDMSLVEFGEYMTMIDDDFFVENFGPIYHAKPKEFATVYRNQPYKNAVEVYVHGEYYLIFSEFAKNMEKYLIDKYF